MHAALFNVDMEPFLCCFFASLVKIFYARRQVIKIRRRRLQEAQRHINGFQKWAKKCSALLSLAITTLQSSPSVERRYWLSQQGTH